MTQSNGGSGSRGGTAGGRTAKGTLVMPSVSGGVQPPPTGAAPTGASPQATPQHHPHAAAQPAATPAGHIQAPQQQVPTVVQPAAYGQQSSAPYQQAPAGPYGYQPPAASPQTSQPQSHAQAGIQGSGATSDTQAATPHSPKHPMVYATTGAIAGLTAAPGAARVSHSSVGQHWPIPASLVAELPQGRAARDLEPNGAEVPFSGSGSVLEWLTYAAQVHHQDKAAERTKKRLTVAIVVSCILGFAGLWLYYSGVVLLVAALILYLKRRKVDKLDVEDRRLEVFSGVLQALAPELKPKKPIEVALDFTAHTKHQTTSVSNVKEFRQCWLELKLPLLDGSQVAATVTLQAKQKSRRKRKYTKVKTRVVEQVTVRIVPPRGKAFRPLPAQARSAAVNGLRLQKTSVGPRHAVLVWCTATTNTVRGRYGLQASGSERLDSRQLLSAIVASYKLTAREERSAA